MTRLIHHHMSFELLPPYTVEDEHLEFVVDMVRETIVAATSND